MYSKGEDLVEGYMEKGKIRLCGEQRINIGENIKIEKDSWGQQGTPT